MRKTPTLLLLGILAVFLVLAYSGYSFWQKSSAEVELETLNNNVADLNNRVLQYQNDRVLEALSAKQAIENLKADDMSWSKIIRDIRQTLPKDEAGNDLVEVLSYSGSRGSELALTLKTVGGSMTPFLDVAKLIATFDNSKNFKDNFVPSIGIGEDALGGSLLSFSLSTTYVKDDVSQLLETQKEVESTENEAQVKASDEALDAEAVVEETSTPVVVPRSR